MGTVVTTFGFDEPRWTWWLPSKLRNLICDRLRLVESLDHEQRRCSMLYSSLLASNEALARALERNEQHRETIAQMRFNRSFARYL
jgi:hypothetical protein